MKRRKNHGRTRPAGVLALDAVRKIVPPDRLRLTRVQIAWPEIAPGHLREVAWPANVQGNTLLLAVLDNQWLHELTYLRNDLLRRIQHSCAQAEIREIRFRVGALPEPWPTTPVRADPVVEALPDEPSRETLDALHDIEDTGLRQLMANARMALSSRLRQ